MAPFLNHSTIAQRTRRKFKTDARGLDTNPKRALTLKQDPKDPRIAQSDAVPKDDYSHPGQTSTDMPPSTTPALIDVSLGPQFRQPLDNLLSWTRIKPDDSEADERSPIYNPRRSGLRIDDTNLSSEEDQFAHEKEEDQAYADESLASNQTEVEVSAVPVSKTDQEKEDPDTTLTQEELQKSCYRFEESIRLHEEKSLAASEEEKEVINFPTYFSDGDKVDEQIQTILDDMDAIDPLIMDDTIMAERIHNLVRRSLNECSIVNRTQTSRTRNPLPWRMAIDLPPLDCLQQNPPLL